MEQKRTPAVLRDHHELAGRRLVSHEVIIETISAVTTRTRLKVTAVLDTSIYPKGIRIPDKDMKAFEARHLQRHQFHGNWNYTSQQTRPATRHARRRKLIIARALVSERARPPLQVGAQPRPRPRSAPLVVVEKRPIAPASRSRTSGGSIASSSNLATSFSRDRSLGLQMSRPLAA